MSRRGSKMPPDHRKRDLEAIEVHAVPPPPTVTPARIEAELVRVNAVLQAAGIRPGENGNGTIAECVAALVNERHQLRVQLALQQQPAAAPQPTATKDAPPG